MGTPMAALLSLLAASVIRVDGRPVALSEEIGVQTTLFKHNSDSRGWLWGWAWGGAQSTVSVVDRSPVVSYASRPASFGSEINDAVLGYVIPLSSFTVPCPSNNSLTNHTNPPSNPGCPDLCLSGSHQPEPTETWIALVQRGQCEFAAKAREAQRLGAKAVVVGGDDPEVTRNPDALVNMYSPGDSSDIEVAATFIKYSDYIDLFNIISSSNTSHSGLRTVSLLITAEYSAWEWYSPIITFFVILILPSLLTFLTLLIHRIRAARQAQRDRAPEDIVRSLPWSVWSASGHLEKHYDGPRVHPDKPSSAEGEGAGEGDGDGEEPSTSNARRLEEGEEEEQPWMKSQVECAICLSDFEVGDKVRVLPCQHVFHMEEVDEWLIQRKKLCPICKSDVTQPWHKQPQEGNGDEQEQNHDVQPTETTPLLRLGSRSASPASPSGANMV